MYGAVIMDFQYKWMELQQKHDNAKFQFVNVELDLAITYCLIAVATADTARSCRNIANAERAYSTAAYFLSGNLNTAQNLEIKAKLDLFRYLRTSCDGSAQMQ